MDYDNLLEEAKKENLIVKEKPLIYTNGRIKGNKVALRKGMTSVQGKCALAEELGHHYTTAGNILDQSKTDNRKQERRARYWAFKKLVSLFDIIRAYYHGCQNSYEMAEYLEVTEEFLREALDLYRSKYGTGIQYDEYMISFEPYLMVYKFQK